MMSPTSKTVIAKQHDEVVKRLQDWIERRSGRKIAGIPTVRNTWQSWRATPDFKKPTSLSRGRKDRHAAGPRHESGRRARRVESAPGPARLRRYRSEHDRRLRSDEHVQRFAAYSSATDRKSTRLNSSHVSESRM